VSEIKRCLRTPQALLDATDEASAGSIRYRKKTNALISSHFRTIKSGRRG